MKPGSALDLGNHQNVNERKTIGVIYHWVWARGSVLFSFNIGIFINTPQEHRWGNK